MTRPPGFPWFCSRLAASGSAPIPPVFRCHPILSFSHEHRAAANDGINAGFLLQEPALAAHFRKLPLVQIHQAAGLDQISDAHLESVRT